MKESEVRLLFLFSFSDKFLIEEKENNSDCFNVDNEEKVDCGDDSNESKIFPNAGESNNSNEEIFDRKINDEEEIFNSFSLITDVVDNVGDNKDEDD